jgi:hypothetical protein
MILSFVSGKLSGINRGKKQAIQLEVIRHISQVGHKSRLLDKLEEKEYELIYNSECLSLYQEVAFIYEIDEEYPDENILESKSVQSFLSDVTAYIENHPESLAFMNSDLFDSSFPDDMFIQDMIYQLQN